MPAAGISLKVDAGGVGDGEKVIPALDDRAARRDDKFLAPDDGGDKDLETRLHGPEIGEPLPYHGGARVDCESQKPDASPRKAENLRCAREFEEVHDTLLTASRSGLMQRSMLRRSVPNREPSPFNSTLRMRAIRMGIRHCVEARRQAIMFVSSRCP